MQFLDSVDITNKRLLLRVDYNVPLKNGVIQDDVRIRESLPTLKYALDRGACLVLCSHFGSPKGSRKPELSLAPVAAHLAQLLGKPVPLAPDAVGPEVEALAKALKPGELLLLENLRFHPGEEKNDPEYAKQLAALGEVYVNDAFGAAHRAHASTAGVAKFMNTCCGGLLLKKEWTFLGETLASPARPYVAISGGAKVSSKLKILTRLLDKVDDLIIGGAMANTFFLAQGLAVGASLVEKELVADAQKIMDSAKAKGVRLHLPVDVVYGSALDAPAAGGTCDLGQVPEGVMILDIGPKSVAAFAAVLAKAKTILWNGPMGAFENPAFATGSVGVAQAVAQATQTGATSIVGGGDTDSLIHKAGVAESVSFVSTGGGAFLEFMEGLELPAFAALRECGRS